MREVTINGKTLKFETGKSLNKTPGMGRPKCELTLILEAMRPGESVKLSMTPDEMGKKTPYLNRAHKATGFKFAYRTEGKRVRLFCVDAPKLRAVA